LKARPRSDKGTVVDDASQEEQEFARQRDQMVREQLAGRGIADERVLEAMRRVPRHHFVPRELQHLAYHDGPLPIGADQTISQPYIVALMTQLLELEGEERVLEIGVGSGYQTAILSLLASEVIGLERVESLAESAAERLDTLGYDNVTIHVGDGSQGLPDDAPFDAILCAAAAPHVPEPMIGQLIDGGRLVIPVGEAYEQILTRMTRRGGATHLERLVPVRFVPLIGRYGFLKGW
jgi:protein-L-isoaspartate(D-aspartate) O-methyltransferase